MGSFNATEASTKLTHCSHSSTRSCKNRCLSMRTDCSPIAPSVVMHKVEAVLDLYTHTRTHYPARISHLSLTRGGILQSVNLWGTHQGQPNFPRSPYPPYPPYVSSWSLMHAQRLCIADFLATRTAQRNNFQAIGFCACGDRRSPRSACRCRICIQRVLVLLDAHFRTQLIYPLCGAELKDISSLTWGGARSHLIFTVQDSNIFQRYVAGFIIAQRE